MPSLIRYKRSSTPTAVPTAGQLTPGEIAINTADGKIYTKNTAGAVLDLTAPPAALDGGEIITDKFATFVSVRITGSILGSCRSTTGYIRVEWWDNTANTYGSGVPTGHISWSKSAAGAGTKTIKIYPSNSSGGLSGELTSIYGGFNNFTSLDIRGLAALRELYVPGNSLSALNLRGASSLDFLNINGNPLAEIDLRFNPVLKAFIAESCSLTALNISKNKELETANLSYNPITQLDVSYNTNLTSLYMDNTAITSLDVSGLPLTWLSCNNCLLTSLRAVGVTGAAEHNSTVHYYSPFYPGVMIANNDLNAAALNQIYTDLADISSSGSFSLINVRDNPGTSDDNPAIATAKNWIVFGS